MGSLKKDILISYAKFPTICAGLWPRPLTKNPYLSKVFYLYNMLARILWFVFYTSLIAELVRLIIHNYSTQIILACFNICANATKIFVKVIIYIKNNVLKLFDDVIDRERELWRKNDTDIIKVYFGKVHTVKIFSILLWTSTVVVAVALHAAGFYGMAQLIKYNQAHNTSLESHYNYEFWFPGNKLEHRNWVYLINAIDSYLGIINNITTHMALITLLMYAASQMEILQYRLQHYIPEDLQEEQMDETIGVLKGFISEHQYLIEFTTKINDKCKNIIMLEYLLSSFDAASVTVSMLTPEVSEVVWLVTMLVLLVIQIFCLAWSCNEVNLQSQGVADGVFKSNWRLLNKEGKQLTQIMIQRAQQRPLMMTIGPFGPMTLQSFLTIWKASYSYLSIMK